MREKETETEEAGSERKGREEWNERFSGWLRKRKSERKKDSAGRRVSCDLRGLLSCCPRGGNPLGQVGSGRPAFSMSRSINTEATGSLSVPSPQSHLIHHGPPPNPSETLSYNQACKHLLAHRTQGQQHPNTINWLNALIYCQAGLDNKRAIENTMRLLRTQKRGPLASTGGSCWLGLYQQSLQIFLLK